MKIHLPFLAVLLALLLPVPSFSQEVLTLEAYLNEVETQGPDHARAVMNRRINEMNRARLGKRWYAGVSGNAGYSGSNGLFYSYDPSVQDYDYFDVYENRYLNFGANAQLGYNFEFGLDVNATYSIGGTYSWYDASESYGSSGNQPRLSVGLQVPLLRNFLGEQTRAWDKMNLLWNDASLASGDHAIRFAIYSAKRAYINLALARAEVQLRQEALEGVKRVLGWAKGRATSLDLLQLQAALEKRTSDLEGALDKERAMGNSFNRARGREGSLVEESVLEPEALSAGSPGEWPVEEPRRSDLEASRLTLEASRLSARNTELDTQLDLLFSASAWANPLGYNLPAPAPEPIPFFRGYSVGLSLNVPIDMFTDLWGLSSRTQRMSLTQQELDFKTLQNDQHRQWEDLALKYQKSGERLANAASLEANCREKMARGESLLKQGQVRASEWIAFVGDHVEARMLRLSWTDQRLDLLALAALYSAGN